MSHTCYCNDPVKHERPATDPVTALQVAVEALGKAMPALVDQADDPEGLALAQLLLDVREARTALYGLELDLEATAAKALMADEVQGSGVKVERYRPRDRKEWDHEAWQRDVRAKVARKHGVLRGCQLLSPEGEVLDLSAYDLMAEVQQVHGAGQPKSTALRQLGLDVSDYCTTTPAAPKVRVLRLADENAEVAEPCS